MGLCMHCYMANNYNGSRTPYLSLLCVLVTQDTLNITLGFTGVLSSCSQLVWNPFVTNRATSIDTFQCSARFLQSLPYPPQHALGSSSLFCPALPPHLSSTSPRLLQSLSLPFLLTPPSTCPLRKCIKISLPLIRSHGRSMDLGLRNLMHFS